MPGPLFSLERLFPLAEYLKLKKSNCVNCYKCIRHCPVKSIKYSTGRRRLSTMNVSSAASALWSVPRTPRKSATMCPRYQPAQGGPCLCQLGALLCGKLSWRHHRHHGKALKQLGFAGVEETAIGASIVKTEYENIVRRAARKSSSPPAATLSTPWWKSTIPRPLPYLATVLSPMQAHCQKIKQSTPR